MHHLTWLTGHFWKISTGVWGHSLPALPLSCTTQAVAFRCCARVERVPLLCKSAVQHLLGSYGMNHFSNCFCWSIVEKMFAVLWLVPKEILFESTCVSVRSIHTLLFVDWCSCYQLQFSTTELLIPQWDIFFFFLLFVGFHAWFILLCGLKLEHGNFD